MNKNRSHKTSFRKHLKWGVLSFIALLIALRLALPFIVLKYVNNSLSEMKGYRGHVQDIDIRLFRSAYQINNINIYETGTELKEMDSIPFFNAEKIDLSLDWNSILHKRIVGEIKMVNPVLNFKNKKSDKTDIESDTADFQHLINKLMPLTINKLKIENSELHYIDKYSSPSLDIVMDSITGLATNLSNVIRGDSLLPANIKASGNCYEGSFSLDAKLDLLNKFPTFDLNTELKGLDLTKVNNFLKAYGNFDVSKGNFSIFAEFAARDGKFKGYIKPLLSDLDVVQWNKEEGNIQQIFWETLVASVAATLTNQKKDQFATKVNMEGDFNKTDISILNAIKYILVNAFIEALKPNLDNTINIKINALNKGKMSARQERIEKRNKKNDK